MIMSQLMERPNAQQVVGWLTVGLAAGGPIGAAILDGTGWSHDRYSLYLNALGYIGAPLIAAGWTHWSARRAKLIATVEKLPEVATVVVKDGANGSVGALAQSSDHPNVVTESQNAKDVKAGAKSP